MTAKAMAKSLCPVIVLLAILTSASIAEPFPAETKEILEKVPHMEGYRFSCERLIAAVNHLRSLGKARAVQALRTYYLAGGKEAQEDWDEQVYLACRCLFVNPEGWTKEFGALGAEQPPVRFSEQQAIPAFPLMFSDRVPFLVLSGYRYSGRRISAASVIYHCESLEIIDSDLPTANLRTAAEALIKSDHFRDLFVNPQDRTRIEEMVRKQAVGAQ